LGSASAWSARQRIAGAMTIGLPGRRNELDQASKTFRGTGNGGRVDLLKWRVKIRRAVRAEGAMPRSAAFDCHGKAPAAVPIGLH
jgi:hypothetical protein